ncbi:hypothetical protein E1B28_001278 [Marasmius oreades]|uniref:PXA domain-containing protein n=1 Tax=Marasmius oreades TaxID=181124 RepID=A0A9P7V320_9AGAR|nr:uncharacterized protein E1B28_001278 [Marasmius oreades]KAG7099426.1 hypothetical protein E1B28_001278 [Marasmius oreades]
MPPSFHSQRSHSASAKQTQPRVSLTNRLIFPNVPNSPSFPSLFCSPTPPELTAEVYDFIALALRAFILPWWSKITRYDKEFLPQINQIITHAFRSLEARILSQSFQEELPGLLFQDIPILVTQHYKDFRNAQSKVTSSYASGGNLSLSTLFHQLQPHIGVDGEGKVNYEYIRQVIDYVLRDCLPEDDYNPESERFIVREIVVKIVAEDVLPKVTQPWFIYKVILDLLDENHSVTPPSTMSQVTQSHSEAKPSNDPSNTAPAPSGSPFSSLLILFLSTIQSISGACLALVHAYKQLVLIIKEVNTSSKNASRMTKPNILGRQETGRSSETKRKRASPTSPVLLRRTRTYESQRMSGSALGTPPPSIDLISISRVSSVSSSDPSTSSAFPQPPPHPLKSGTNGVNDARTSKFRMPSHFHPPLTLLSEIFTLYERHASRTIVGTAEMLIGALNTEGFVDRLLPHLLNRHISNPGTLLSIVRSAKQTLFPNGYPQPAPPDPSPEETAEMRQRIITFFNRPNGKGGRRYSKATMTMIQLLLGSDPDETMELALEPLGSQECNAHLVMVLVDRVVCEVWPELAEG